MYEVYVKGGAYATPPGTCAFCGGLAAGDHVIKAGNSDTMGKTFLSVGFPLCDGCAAVHEKHYERPLDSSDDAVLKRVEEAKKANQAGGLASFLSLVALVALIAGAIWILPLAWWIGLLLAIGTWIVLAAIVFRDKVKLSPEDQARLKAIKAENREWDQAHAAEDRELAKAIGRCVSVKNVSRGGATFRFSNPAYGHAFAQANRGRATERAA